MVGAGPGPTGAGNADVVPLRKLQQARDALVAHMVSLHTAAAEAAQGKPVLEPDDEEPGGIGSGGLLAAQRWRQADGDTAVMQEVAFRVLSDLALVFGSTTWKVSRDMASCFTSADDVFFLILRSSSQFAFRHPCAIWDLEKLESPC